MYAEAKTAPQSRSAAAAAAATHDLVNAIGITPLVLLTLYAMWRPCMAVDTALSWATLAYITFDTWYHVLVPQCQPSTFRFVTILFHHALTICLVLFPIMNPRYMYFTKYVTLVEINTIALVANKLLKWRLTNVAFLATWVALRLVWKPYLVVFFHQKAMADGFTMTDYRYSQVIGTLTILCVLNLVWTIEVVVLMLRRKRRNLEAEAASSDASTRSTSKETFNEGEGSCHDASDLTRASLTA